VNPEEFCVKDAIFSTPGNKHPIKTVFAWLSVDENGNEGIMADPFPLVSSQEDLRDFASPLIESIRRDPRSKGYKFKFAKFIRVEE
jgi:hypothetical protein